MNIFRNNKHSRKGFTLVEILIAVGIVAVLTAIAIPSISAISKSLHQKQLDDYAQSVYLAAQDNLVSLRRNGTITKFEDEALYPTVLKQEKNAKFPSAEENEGAMEYAFITSYNSNLSFVLPEDSIDASVRNGFSYLIEFNRYTGDVYAVFLSDDPSVILNDSEEADPYENLTAWCGEDNDIRGNHKLRRQHTVGYYQGELVASGEIIHKEGTYGAFVELRNGQEFLVNVYVPIPENMQGSSTFKNSIKNITLSITGLSSGTTITYDMMEDAYKAVETDVKNNTGSVVEYCYSMPLQSLVNERDFGLEEQGFIPGENVSISARVNSTAIDIEDSNLVDGNPWFTSYESAAGIIWLSNGRHLQNLEKLNKSAEDSAKLDINAITLSNSIDWLSTKAFYADPNNVGGRAYVMNFIPVENDFFVKNSAILLNGNKNSIENLYIDDYENDVDNTGLFRVYNAKVQELTLTNPTVRGSKSPSANVGAFAGTLENSASLETVQVRIDRAEKAYANYATTPDWTGVCGLGNTGLLAGYNKGDVNRVVISTSLKGGYYGVPVSGINYGLVSGVNEGKLAVSSFLGVLKAGSASVLGGVAGQNNGTIQILDSYDLTVGSAALPVVTDIFGGVAGSNSGTMEAAGEIYLNASFQDTKTDNSANGTSSPFIYGGVVGSMSGGSVTGFTVCLEKDTGVSYTVSASNRAVNIGGIVGRLTGTAKFYDDKDRLPLALDDFNLAVSTSSAYGEAYVGGLVGYSAVPVNDATLSLSKTNIEVSAGSSNAYVGGMLGMDTGYLSDVSLNSIGSKANKIHVKSFSTAFVGGISGGLGTSMTNGWLLTLEAAPLTLEVGNGNKTGTAFVGGLVGEGQYSDGKTLGRGTVASSLIKVDSPENHGESRSNATSLRLNVSANKAVVGGLVAQLNSSADAIGTVKGCSTQGVDIRISANAVYAGGAVGINNGSIGGANEADAVSVHGSLESKTAASTKYVGGAVGMEADSTVDKTYQNVTSAVSLSGWSKGVAGSVYEDPAQLGVNVGQFIGYVKDGSFTNCASTVESFGGYQFLGKIFCGEEDSTDTTKYFVTYAEPTEEVKKAMLEPVSDYESINALAAHYGLQLADAIAKHQYQASLNNCTYISEAEVYDQFINTEQTTWRYAGHSDFGHYRFVPLDVDINGLYAPNLFSGYRIDQEVEIFLYDKVNGNLLYSPEGDVSGLAKILPVSGRKVSQTELENGIIYLNEDEENLLSYRWSIMAREKYIINPDIIDRSTLRVTLYSRGRTCMVPFVNDSRGIAFFNPLGSNIDILHLFNDEYNVPEMLTLDKQSDGSYVICQRSYYPDRIVYNKEGNYYYSSRTYSNENTRFQLLAYTPLSKDVNSQGWYFTPEGSDSDQICTYAKHTAE